MVPKKIDGYFKIRSYVAEHTYNHNQSSLRSNHHKTTTSFVCNVILSVVRKKLDISLGYIIEYIKAKHHVNITYNNA